MDFIEWRNISLKNTDEHISTVADMGKSFLVHKIYKQMKNLRQNMFNIVNNKKNPRQHTRPPNLPPIFYFVYKIL